MVGQNLYLSITIFYYNIRECMPLLGFHKSISTHLHYSATLLLASACNLLQPS